MSFRTFFTTLVDGEGTGKVRHMTKEKAVAEANRLAQKEAPKNVYLLEAVARFTAPMPKVNEDHPEGFDPTMTLIPVKNYPGCTEEIMIEHGANSSQIVGRRLVNQRF